MPAAGVYAKRTLPDYGGLKRAPSPMGEGAHAFSEGEQPGKARRASRRGAPMGGEGPKAGKNDFSGAHRRRRKGSDCICGQTRDPELPLRGKMERGRPGSGSGHTWEAASSSATITQFRCSCRMEAGTRGVTGPRRAWRRISALPFPLTTIRIRRACIMSRMPMV